MNIKFSRELIKGRIAEVIFEQMIREEERYEVIPFGYEHTVPTLAQYQEFVEIKRVMKNIKDAPDFALISNDKKEVYLVEVKYQSELNIEQIKKYAVQQLKRWDPSWLFIACPNGFFCSSCHAIIKEGDIERLRFSWVQKKRQEDYLQLLNEFEKK